MLLSWPWFCILILSPIVYGHIGFGLLNALCHKNGEPRNSFIVNVLTGGEGYHKNHHENPRAWHIGAIDPAAWFIRLIKK
jgi:fatty-acid desaturase